MWPVAFILHLSFSGLSTEALSARPLATFESKQTPAGLPILDCRSPVRLPLPSSSWIYASIVSHTSWSILTSWLRSLNRKRRGKAEIRTADLHIHDPENVSALDPSTTVGRQQKTLLIRLISKLERFIAIFLSGYWVHCRLLSSSSDCCFL